MSWKEKIKKFFEKERWALVATLETDASHGNDNIPREQWAPGKIYYHLYESSKKTRKLEVESTFHTANKSTVVNFAKSTELYHEKIYRWLQGRYDPDILSFDAVPEEDTFNALKGSVD